MTTRGVGLVMIVPVGVTVFAICCKMIPLVAGKLGSCCNCLAVIRIPPADGVVGVGSTTVPELEPANPVGVRATI